MGFLVSIDLVVTMCVGKRVQPYVNVCARKTNRDRHSASGNNVRSADNMEERGWLLDFVRNFRCVREKNRYRRLAMESDDTQKEE